MNRFNGLDLTMKIAENGVIVCISKGETIIPEEWVFNDPNELGEFIAKWSAHKINNKAEG